MNLNRSRLLVSIAMSLAVCFYPLRGYPDTGGSSASQANKPLSAALTFDVISVKPHKNGEDGWSYRYRPNVFYAANIAPEDLITKHFRARYLRGVGVA